MSQVSRTTKNLEAPRPLKLNSNNRVSHYVSSNIALQSIEELISLIESVADSVSIGQCNPDSISMLLTNLRSHGPLLEEYSKSTLDQAYVKFRNASQDERLSIITRMNLLELIELRAKGWQVSDGLNTYYKQKVSDVQSGNNSEAAAAAAATMLQNLALLDTNTSPSTQSVLNPGEIIRVSGKFTKPTKIPGKSYTKDEVVIRNADSGKVMGIKGRRVHMIEELSETIISFQRVNPGAKERLVQITGPNEEKINYAKQLIEDTIRRNASPVRMDASGNSIGAAVSCSSLTSSNSDEAQPLVNTRNAIIQQQQQKQQQQQQQQHKSRSTGPLLHSLSTNDASLGEYKYTVNVGQNSIKITGDNIELVRISKLLLDEYFASNEFVSGAEAGAEFGLVNSTSAASTIPVSHQLNSTSPFVDSGVGLNVYDKYGRVAEQTSIENDDDVFIVEDDDVTSATKLTTNDLQPNGLTRSRRSHFSHADAATDEEPTDQTTKSNNIHISYEYDRLIYYSKSPHSWELPRDWLKICELYPNIVRNKNIDDEQNRFNADLYLKHGQMSIQKATTSITTNISTILDADDKKSDGASDSD